MLHTQVNNSLDYHADRLYLLLQTEHELYILLI
jgi:hypothetical protein